jgi:hypothetical protein
MMASSNYNDWPAESPRPLMRIDGPGGRGAGTLILEEDGA